MVLRLSKATWRWLSLIAFFWISHVINAQANDALVVYIKCSHETKGDSFGSGVVVSAQGHIVTARHVAPDDEYECWAVRENNTKPLIGIVDAVHSAPLNDNIDGKLMRFVPSEGEIFDFATFCPLTPDLVQERVFAKGFHRKSRGTPSVTSGVISNGILTSRGIIETDALTVSGKSGGPVFLDGSDSIIGIVAGAEFEPTGLPTFYGVVAAEVLAPAFGVMRQSGVCSFSAADVAQLPKGACGDYGVDADQPICALNKKIDVLNEKHVSSVNLDPRIELSATSFDAGEFIDASIVLPADSQAGFFWAGLLIEDEVHSDLILPLLPDPRNWDGGILEIMRRDTAFEGMVDLLKHEDDPTSGAYWTYEVDPSNRFGQIFVIQSMNEFHPPSGRDAASPEDFLAGFEEAIAAADIVSVVATSFNLN